MAKSGFAVFVVSGLYKSETERTGSPARSTKELSRMTNYNSRGTRSAHTGKGWRVSEVARYLGCAESTVRSAYKAGLAKLRRSLQATTTGEAIGLAF